MKTNKKMEISNLQLNMLADGLHPRFAFTAWDTENDWEQLIVCLSRELRKHRLKEKNNINLEFDIDLLGKVSGV